MVIFPIPRSRFFLRIDPHGYQLYFLTADQALFLWQFSDLDLLLTQLPKLIPILMSQRGHALQPVKAQIPHLRAWVKDLTQTQLPQLRQIHRDFQQGLQKALAHPPARWYSPEGQTVFGTDYILKAGADHSLEVWQRVTLADGTHRKEFVWHAAHAEVLLAQLPLLLCADERIDWRALGARDPLTQAMLACYWAHLHVDPSILLPSMDRPATPDSRQLVLPFAQAAKSPARRIASPAKKPIIGNRQPKVGTGGCDHEPARPKTNLGGQARPGSKHIGKRRATAH